MDGDVLAPLEPRYYRLLKQVWQLPSLSLRESLGCQPRASARAKCIMFVHTGLLLCTRPYCCARGSTVLTNPERLQNASPAPGFSRAAELRPVHNTTLHNALRCVVFASTLVETQHDARIDSDFILASPCVAFLSLVVKDPRLLLVINLCVSRIYATQDLASLCEPTFRLETYRIPFFSSILTKKCCHCLVSDLPKVLQY